MKKLTIGLSALALATTGIAGTAYAKHHMGGNPDANGDGIVTRTEAKDQASRMFTQMDVNKDGKLDQADRDARQEQRRGRMFAQMDADKDGKISRDEFMAFDHRGMRGDRPHPGQRNSERGHAKMMQRADTNNDGAVSKAEFTAGALAHFDRIDTNKDGKASAEERLAARQEMRGKWREQMRDRAPD